MRPQKIIAAVMLLMSSVLMAVTSRDVAYPAILCILGLLGLQRRFTWDIRPNRRIIRSWLLLLVAILLALHYRYTPRAWAGQERAIALAWQTVARYFLASMVLMLFLGSARQLPPSLGLFHIAITICTGQILLLDDLLVLFRLLELLSVILVVLYAATASVPSSPIAGSRRGHSAHWATAAAILVIAANTGWIFGSLLYQHVEVLNYVPLWLARQGRLLEQMAGTISSVGFTTSGRLSSMQNVLQDQDATVALTLDGRSNPGYLRARAFKFYRQSGWQDPSNPEPLFSAESNPLSVYFGGRTNTFRMGDSDYPDLEYVTIRHESAFQGAAFTPAGTVTVETSLLVLLNDDDGIVYAPSLATGKSYRVGYTQRAFRNEPTGTQLRSMLSLPSPFDPRLKELAGRVFAGRTTTAEKIDAVIDHFRTHYSYSLSMDIPEDQDKLMCFLLDGSSGYCEYFASGAAILLRLAGVPTRYVTGFFVTQKGERSGSWIARNMDAHAWAEAWDEQRKSWTIVEATVQGGPNTNPANETSGQVEEGLGIRLRRLMEALYQYGLLGLIGWLFASYGVFASSLTLSVFLGGLIGWAWIRLRHRSDPDGAGSRSKPSPTVATMHRMLARMDHRLQPMGLRRNPAETLHAFAARIHDGNRQSIAAWYLLYADLRYARSISPQQLQHLRQAIQHL